jgi:hypothetical protein
MLPMRKCHPSLQLTDGPKKQVVCFISRCLSMTWLLLLLEFRCPVECRVGRYALGVLVRYMLMPVVGRRARFRRGCWRYHLAL